MAAKCFMKDRYIINLPCEGGTVSLNIKNEETCRLASELANLTGETMTGAITVALLERLERENNERSTEAHVQRLPPSEDAAQA